MDNMDFPKTPAEFIKQYSFNDVEGIYTNGTEQVPVFRVDQLIDHYYVEPEQEFLACIEAEFAALRALRDELQKQNDFLRGQLDLMTELHGKAVDRVNKVTFAKLKVENQLELLQSMIGSVLARFQVDTEEED